MDTRALVSSAGLIVLASCFVCDMGVAQWSVGAEVGADRFWGGAVERAGLHRSLLPYRPTTFVLSVDRQSGKATIGMRLGYFSAGLALEGADGLSAVKGVFQVYSASPELRYQLATPGLTNHLLVHGGPIIEVWSIGDDGSETRVGGQVALSLSIPVGGRLAGSVRAGVAVIASPLVNGQTDETFGRRPLWRRQVAAGLCYRL
jgi:hypothetical protein